MAQKKTFRAKKAAVPRPKSKATQEPDGIKRNASKDILGLNYNGMFYPLDGLDDEDFKYVENHLNAERKSPGETLKEEFAKVKGDADLERHLAKLAYEDMRKKPSVDRVTAADVNRFLNTREGATMSLWLMMRKHEEGITLDDVGRIFADCALADMHRRIDEANADLIEAAGVAPPAAPEAETPEPAPPPEQN